MEIIPAPANSGINFIRTDVKDVDNVIPARVEYVTDTRLCTRISNKAGVFVCTTEHTMAGLAACGIHNAFIKVNSPELPALDGSALDHARKLLTVGVKKLDEQVKVIKILKPVRVDENRAWASLEPAEFAEMAFNIVFPNPIGNQVRSMNLCNGSIVKHIIDCRTFVLKSDIKKLQKNGYGLGGNRKNVLIADVKENCYEDSPRQMNEPCGHKMLDAVGDLSLAGYPIIGKFTGFKSGHSTTVALLRKMFTDKDAYKIELADSKTAATLPGAGAALDDIPRQQ